MGWESGAFNASYEKQSIQGDAASITVNGTRFNLDDVDRLAMSFVRSRAQGSWGKLTAGGRVGAGETVADLNLHGGQTSADWCEWFPLWDQFCAFSDAELKPRIRSQILTTLSQGGTVPIGGLTKNSGGRATLTQEGLKAKTLFSKVVPWSSLVGTSVELMNYRFHVDKGGGKVDKLGWMLGIGEWNAWVLPDLIAHFNPR